MPLGRALLSASALLALAPLKAEAGEKRLFVDVAAVSALHDRGEQIGREVVELGAGIEVEVQESTVYGAFYRLLPAGAVQGSFDDEADFTLGVAWDRENYSADISANLLTFPGEETKSSLELAGAVTLHVPLAPTVSGFYDADLEDWEIDVTVGPDWQASGWTLYALGRAGFVQPGDGSAHRSYAGVEVGAVHPVSASVNFGLFARADAADEESFARRFADGEIVSFRNTGVAAGVSLSLSR